MKTILISALVLILLAGAILFYRDHYVKRKVRKLAAQRYQVVSPLIQKLDSKEGISSMEVLTMVKDPSLRHGVFRVLEAYNRNDLFPAEFLTRERGAEGFLVNWLEFPTELGIPPDEIKFLSIVTILENEPLDYYVFQYKTKLPHWVGQHQWMLGVSGPYRDDSKPYDVPLRVYSRFNTVDTILPELEVQWVHENINQSYTYP
jgi:hypothetical protein